MHFVRVGKEFINLAAVAKVKDTFYNGERALVIVYADESVLSTRIKGKDASTLWDYMTRVAAEEVLV